MALTFDFVDEIQKPYIQLKAMEWYFPVVLFIMLYQVVLYNRLELKSVNAEFYLKYTDSYGNCLLCCNAEWKFIGFSEMASEVFCLEDINRAKTRDCKTADIIIVVSGRTFTQSCHRETKCLHWKKMEESF